MNISVSILDGPLTSRQVLTSPGAGAVVKFHGIVRELEDGRVLQALHYDTYEPMAQKMLEAIAREIAKQNGLSDVHVSHSRGRVGVGECSFQLVMAAPHRKEALAAMDAFIDRMKQDVPIWKRPIWQGALEESAQSDLGNGQD